MAAQPKRPNWWDIANNAQTLIEAHEALSRLMPDGDAPKAVWKSFYVRSGRVYRRIAEVDRGHHHEALYWATREEEKAEAIGSE
ncbi:hypothetical protein KCV87_17630 [Actinosynnema pretiosum subsp. pretiosum]|uniref:Uncharacterized protein n=1 Tax=Actinosynnema pretiosum subsp. pretiosum TaxID=103721 RepID=A0AA45R790_9PSEU|nr:hypothetical protein APASM_0552 [Actinosynnema pretiosum subsp. pretiosum]QUF07654.1 hypothetical protein KCV87_17630 [Actinosynnema pretiosum subsp. pretiosum]